MFLPAREPLDERFSGSFLRSKDDMHLCQAEVDAVVRLEHNAVCFDAIHLAAVLTAEIEKNVIGTFMQNLCVVTRDAGIGDNQRVLRLSADGVGKTVELEFFDQRSAQHPNGRRIGSSSDSPKPSHCSHGLIP